MKQSRHPNSDRGRTPTPEKDRFVLRLDKISGPIHPICGKCWVLKPTSRSTTGIPIRHARMAWRVQVGEIPDGLQVLHRCDNSACVNPDHLFLGTISDNMLDAYEKGRKSMIGNQNALGHIQSKAAKKTKSLKSKASWKEKRKSGTDGFKLSKKQVEEIRKKYKRTSYLKSNSRELALEYGVNYNHINRIVARKQRA